MIACGRSLKHLKIHTLDHGALVFSQASEEKATWYGLWCLPNMPEWSRLSFSSYAETDRSRLVCTPMCYHKQKGRDLLQNKVDPHSDFLEKNPVCLARYRSMYPNQTRGDSTFNDSDSDSDSSTPFRFRFRLRLQSSWLRFRLRFRLQHYFYERFRFRLRFQLRVRLRFNSDSSTPYILIVTPELYKFWFKYQPRCTQNV